MVGIPNQLKFISKKKKKNNKTEYSSLIRLVNVGIRFVDFEKSNASHIGCTYYIIEVPGTYYNLSCECLLYNAVSNDAMHFFLNTAIYYKNYILT